MDLPDRRKELQGRKDITGIDFVYVEKDQVHLKVFFLNTPVALNGPQAKKLSKKQITIVCRSKGEQPQSVKVKEITGWGAEGGRDVLLLETESPGGFSDYSLSIDDERVDPYFNRARFSFKAHCESDLDCRPPPHECPPEKEVDFPVDYKARDFWSFRRALLDFAAQRYPDWKDRLEADAGVMLAEVMSALGDELAYYQDRLGREGYLETASQRRSLRRHARLVDYHIHDGLAGTTWLDVTVKGGQHTIEAGSDVWALTDRVRAEDLKPPVPLDEATCVYFEVGGRFAERSPQAKSKKYPVSFARNRFEVHIWDEDDTCVSVGATELFVKHDQTAHFPANSSVPDDDPRRWLLLKTQPESAGARARRWMVRVTRVELAKDPLGKGLNPQGAVTRLAWGQEHALPFEIDLTWLEVRGNMVPATAGRTLPARDVGAGALHVQETPVYRFVVGVDPDDKSLALDAEGQKELTRAIERQGPNGTTTYLFSLPGTDATPLAWVGESSERARPEVRLVEVERDGNQWKEKEGPQWHWRRSLLGTYSSFPTDHHFTLDDGTWKRAVGYQRRGREIVHKDYASGDGSTIRFGDGEFGRLPKKGTIFQVTYRLGGGRSSNVSADSLVRFDRTALPFVEKITNPFAVTNGVDAETPEQVRRLAPDAFRAITFRAVRPEDYAEAAERLPWVDHAGAAFRWTGSWLTAFVTPDPHDSVSLKKSQHRELVEQLDRFRQAGREAHVADPRYADIDLKITVCVEPYAYCGQVKERILHVLLGRPGRPGFFGPDNFTFGTPLSRSRLEAEIQGVSGVRAVEGTSIRRRGVFDWRPLTGQHFPLSHDEIIRLENDPAHPERGTLHLNMKGGA